MKLVSLTIISIVMLFSITMWWDTGTVNPENGEISLYGVSSTNATGFGDTQPYILYLITRPADFSNSNPFWNWWNLVFLIGIGAVGIVAGLFRFQTSDAITFIGLIAILLVLAAISVTTLNAFLQAELSSYVCGGTGYCFLSSFFAGMTSSIWLFLWLFSIFKFMRTGFPD